MQKKSFAIALQINIPGLDVTNHHTIIVATDHYLVPVGINKHLAPGIMIKNPPQPLPVPLEVWSGSTSDMPCTGMTVLP